jgi:hypothetical protein
MSPEGLCATGGSQPAICAFDVGWQRLPQARASLPRMAWKLDPAEVDWGTSGSSSAPFTKGPTRHGGTPARREMTFSLTHRPTGIRVERHVVGPFTRKQAQEAKARLWDELFPVLEGKVAKHLHVPGR